MGTCRVCDYHVCAQCVACELPCHCVALDQIAAIQGDVPLDHVDSLIILFLPPHAMQDYVEKQAARWSEILAKKLEQKVKLIVADVPFDASATLCDKGYCKPK